MQQYGKPLPRKWVHSPLEYVIHSEILNGDRGIFAHIERCVKESLYVPLSPDKIDEARKEVDRGYQQLESETRDVVSDLAVEFYQPTIDTPYRIIMKRTSLIADWKLPTGMDRFYQDELDITSLGDILRTKSDESLSFMRPSVKEKYQGITIIPQKTLYEYIPAEKAALHTPVEKIQLRFKGKSKIGRKILDQYFGMGINLDKHEDAIDYGVTDPAGIRIIVEDEKACYDVLNLLKVRPNIRLEDNPKDYIKKPKPNGYQAIHALVKTKSELFVEIQIRSQQMHIEAEENKASHNERERRKELMRNEIREKTNGLYTKIEDVLDEFMITHSRHINI